MADGVRQGRGGIPVRPTTWRERLGALRNLPPFLAMVWGSSRLLTATTVAVRLVRALLPVATLFVGKLIIDEVVHLTHLTARPVGLAGWLGSGLLSRLEALLLAEFALAVASDLLGRIVSLVDGLLSDRVSNDASVRLMEHAATLDLADFEDAAFQDRMDRARMQASGRMSLMGQLFGQA
jgi:ATP-binding cassette subfamily B protein